MRLRFGRENCRNTLREKQSEGQVFSESEFKVMMLEPTYWKLDTNA